MENTLRHQVPGMPTKSRSKVKRVFIISLIIPAFILGYIFSYYYILPSIFPNILRGELQSILAFPTAEGKYKLWIQTDGTFRTTSRTNNMGQISLKTVGWFCRTYSYVYDPINDDIVNGFKTSYEDLPPEPHIIYEKEKIWVVNSSSDGVPPAIKVYDSKNYKEILNTQSFCEKNKELSSGIENLSADNQYPPKLRISTKDGREVVYCIPDDKFFPNSIELEKYYKQIDTTVSGIFSLTNEENSGKRKKLYYVTGPKYELYFSYSWTEEIVKQNISAFKNLKASEMLPGKVFIEGEILFTDDEFVVIVHQDNVGKNANRMLTCIDKSGKELWTAQQEDLFDEMEATEDSRTDMSVMVHNLAAQRAGDVVVFIFKPVGAIGFELATGKKLWEFEG